MSRPLPIRTIPKARETLFSFVCRMAAVNRMTPEQFCHDLEFSIRGVTLIEAPTIKRIQRLCDLNDDQIGELISWTGRKTGVVPLGMV